MNYYDFNYLKDLSNSKVFARVWDHIDKCYKNVLFEGLVTNMAFEHEVGHDGSVTKANFDMLVNSAQPLDRESAPQLKDDNATWEECILNGIKV